MIHGGEFRAELRHRCITSVIPEPAEQQGHRKRRGSRGGRPVSYDRNLYKGRNVVELPDMGDTAAGAMDDALG